ncbi:MAG: sigma-70 family RNA polymerase sigma factor [Actinomycetota bacterium]|nr:sigma-70 family RNA polymerase sigma factor [Actinomycetota bacterium]
MTARAQDAELLARVVAGDHEAFNEIMRSHEDRVFSVCLRIMGNREHALDATQETFLTVFRKAEQFKGDSALGTWIYRIAVNTCYDLLRKQKRRPSEPMPEHFEPADHSAEEEVEAAALRPEIRRALGSIPPEFRSAVVLADIEGMSLLDTAQILGVPVGTVKSRVFRGRRLLAKQLGNQHTP